MKPRTCLSAAFMLATALASTACAAPPPVELQNDPHLVSCPAVLPGTLKKTGAVISPDASAVYEAGFDPVAWAGSVRKRRIGFDGPGDVSLQPTEWDAADLLTNLRPEVRRIYTTGDSNATISFDWERLTASQKSMLNISPVSGRPDNWGQQRLQYLRGDRSLEQGNANGQFRRRRKLLGAIVNSTPVFAGPPSASILEPGYQDFYQRYQRRMPAVFAGADDGMLHAFNADSGSELFAYVPRMLFPALVQLTRPDSVRRAFVDGPIRIAEAFMGSEWKTVLVAAMRGGAQGVFALDVTDPWHFDEGTGALWEFSDADDPHMGNVIGTPAIAKLYVGMRKGLRSYRYFAIVTAGLNNYVDDGAGRSEPGAANALFLLALDKPSAEKWKAGSNYIKLVLPAGESNSANGLSEPALVVDDDGVLRHVYVGDLQGNLWRFDFTGTLPWTNAMGTGTPKPLFIASDEQGFRQPITAKPAIAYTRAGYLLLFGTGRLLESRDLIDERMQSFYAVQDDPDKRSDAVRRSQLARRNAMAGTDGSVEISGSVLPSGKDAKGWYIDLPEPGERVLRAADIAGHMAYFDTLRPSADSCRGAIARSYVVDTLSGLPPDNVVTGIPFDPQDDDGAVVLPPAASSIAPRDASGKRKVEIRRIRITDTETTEGAKAKDRTSSTQTMTTGRLSWRELVDWNGRQK